MIYQECIVQFLLTKSKPVLFDDVIGVVDEIPPCLWVAHIRLVVRMVSILICVFLELWNEQLILHEKCYENKYVYETKWCSFILWLV